MAHVLRVATIERFAAELAHELNQPLTAIANDVETCATHIRSGKGGARRLLVLLERAGAEALRAGEIVHHLREFVKRTTPRLDSVNLCDVVRDATRWLAREMEHDHIALRLEVPPEKLFVLIDRVQIEQVLVNLMQNAVDAIRETGDGPREIQVRVSRTATEWPRWRSTTPAPASRLRRPSACSSPSSRPRCRVWVWALAICLTIAEMHRGRMFVEPLQSGRGTTVRLLLPLQGSA